MWRAGETQILWLTEPDKWSPQATFAAARIFASNMNGKLVQRFYNTVLLPAVLDDIQTHKWVWEGRLTQEAELPSVPGAEEGDVQAGGLLQGDSAAAVRGGLHAARGGDREQRAGEGVGADGAQRGGADEDDGVAVGAWERDDE